VRIIRSEQGEAAGFVTLVSDHQLALRGGEFQRLSKMALLDPVSLAFSKPHGELRLHARLDEMRRYYADFGVLFVGIDRFKDVCASYGSRAGGQILKSVAKTLTNGLRGSDVVSRWAEEHFLIILLRVDDGELAALAHRLLRLVQGCAFSVGDRQISVTASIGATVARRDDTANTLVDRARDLMRRSSATGGNRVTVQAGL
jgi:diguanylate cyclase (GGDEF)-like protein